MIKTFDAEKLQLVSLVNGLGTQLKILNFGAAVFSLRFSSGKNVVVGPKNPEDYLTKLYHQRGKHFGASVGRHAGRISGGGFQIKETKYSIFGKDGIHLHGGDKGFSYKFWQINEVKEGKDPFVILEYFSPNGEEGYPGNLHVKIKYTLTEDDVIGVEYTAETDEETIVNLTNHTYFNLNGSGSIIGHELQIEADKVLETDDRNVPTGKFESLEGKEIDFRTSKKIGKANLDHVYSLEGEKKIKLKGDRDGISLEVKTNQPAVVVYVPEVLPKDWEYSTAISANRAAICLETQQYPDAPHHPEFPGVILKPGEVYHNYTSWKFETGL